MREEATQIVGRAVGLVTNTLALSPVDVVVGCATGDLVSRCQVSPERLAELDAQRSGGRGRLVIAGVALAAVGMAIWYLFS